MLCFSLFSCTTLPYRAPEMIDLYSGHKITTKSDIWVCHLILSLYPVSILWYFLHHFLSDIDTLISKRLPVENKAKLWKLETPPPQYCLFTISNWESFVLFSTNNRFEISLSMSLLSQNLPLLVERVLLCSLHTIALKLVCQFCYSYKICPC